MADELAFQPPREALVKQDAQSRTGRASETNIGTKPRPKLLEPRRRVMSRSISFGIGVFPDQFQCAHMAGMNPVPKKVSLRGN